MPEDSTAVEACKNGGYVSYVDPETGQPFENQGKCVSFAARGGTLTPVGPPAPDVTLSLVTRGTDVYVQAEGTATPFARYEVVWVADGVASDPTTVQVGEFGIFQVSFLPLPGQTVELLIDGVSAGSITADPANALADGTGVGNTVTWVVTGPDGEVKSTGTTEVEVKANGSREGDHAFGQR